MNLDSMTLLDSILIIGLALCGIGALFAIIVLVTDFQRDLKYINMEIGRTEGKEREYWLKEKRKLWLSLLPFYRR